MIKRIDPNTTIQALMLIAMIWQTYLMDRQYANQRPPIVTQIQNQNSSPSAPSAPITVPTGWMASVYSYWPIGVMVILIVVNSTIAARHRKGLSDTAKALAAERAKKPYPKVEIWRHSASSTEQADKIKRLFVDSGWEVDDSHSTNLGQHANGVTLCGGTSFNRNVAVWGLSTMQLKAVIEQRNEPPKELQVIIGAIDPSEAKTVGQWSVEQMAGQRDAAVQAAATCQKEFALARLRWLAERAEDRKVNVEVLVRFAEYQDYDLAQKIVGIFKEHMPKWSVEVEQAVKPVLKPAGEHKVVFDSGFMQSYMEIAAAFSDGKLVDATIGLRRSDRFSEGDKVPPLIVEVLPTVKKT